MSNRNTLRNSIALAQAAEDAQRLASLYMLRVALVVLLFFQSRLQIVRTLVSGNLRRDSCLQSVCSGPDSYLNLGSRRIYSPLYEEA